MKFILAILIILCPPVFAAEPVVTPQADGSVVITLPVEIVKMCEEQGGCKIISLEQFLQLMQQIKPKLCNQLDV